MTEDTSLREKALRDGWLDIDERAVSGERILLLWAPFRDISEHVEIGGFSQEKGGWVNTYGKPFHSAPDKYAPLAPFDASAVLDDKDRRIEALEAALKPFAAVEPMDVCEDEDEDARGCYVLTQSDFKAARAALSGKEGQS